MTLDSLEDAFVHGLLAELSIERHRAEEVALTLAAAAREWFRQHLPLPPGEGCAEIARRLGLR